MAEKGEDSIEKQRKYRIAIEVTQVYATVTL